jgi:hypothetical protein
LKTSGKHVQLLPVGPQTEIAIAGNQRVNTGLFVRSILEKPHLTHSKTVVQVTDVVTKGEMLRVLGRITGNKAELIKIPIEDYDRLFPAWGFEMGGMLQYFEWMGGWKESWGVDDTVVTGEALGVVGVEGFEEGLKKWYQKDVSDDCARSG